MDRDVHFSPYLGFATQRYPMTLKLHYLIQPLEIGTHTTFHNVWKSFRT